MKYFKIVDKGISVPFEKILEKASETEDDIMLSGDKITTYESDGLNFLDLIKFISFKKDKIFLSALDVNPSFDYEQFFEMGIIQLPILIDCFSFCEERLSRENLTLEKDLFKNFKEKDIGFGKVIMKIYGGFPDVLKNEFQENVDFLTNNNLGEICLVPYPYNFSVVNYYSFREYIMKYTRNMLNYPPLALPSKNDLE